MWINGHLVAGLPLFSTQFSASAERFRELRTTWCYRRDLSKHLSFMAAMHSFSWLISAWHSVSSQTCLDPCLFQSNMTLHWVLSNEMDHPILGWWEKLKGMVLLTTETQSLIALKVPMKEKTIVFSGIQNDSEHYRKANSAYGKFCWL